MARPRAAATTVHRSPPLRAHAQIVGRHSRDDLKAWTDPSGSDSLSLTAVSQPELIQQHQPTRSRFCSQCHTFLARRSKPGREKQLRRVSLAARWVSGGLAVLSVTNQKVANPQGACTYLARRKALRVLVAVAFAMALGMVSASSALATTSTHGALRTLMASGNLHFVPEVTEEVNGVSVTYYNIQNHSLDCLDANSNDYPSNGDNIQLWPCNDNHEQLWSYNASTRNIYNYDDTYCLDADSTYFGDGGDPVQLWTCNNNPEQTWTGVSSPGWANIVASTSIGAQCLDAESQDYPYAGDPIQLWFCNSNPEQLWRST
jgi:Ricin-type beta-trefoil lectin domain